MKKTNIDKRLIIGVALFAIIQIFMVWQPKETKESIPPASVDTFVPLGFTLVPIQIENHSELQSLVDRFAIVDLHKKGHAETIATDVRLLRSPKNPEVFAVLIEQDRARNLISKYGAQFTVSVKSPNSEPGKEKPKRTIVRN